MTEDLQNLLAERAARARTPGDPVDVVDSVAGRVELRTRRRRSGFAVASGVAVVAAAATVGVVIANPGADNSAGRPVQTQVGAYAPRVRVHPKVSGDAVQLPHLAPLKTTVGHGVLPEALKAQARRQALARRAAHMDAERARVERARTGHGTSLVAIAPAPPAAEISLGLVPKGSEYLSLDDANTFYGTPGTSPGDYFSKGIVVDVHQFIGDAKDYTRTVNGMPASYGRSDGYTIVRLRYSKHVDVGFQAPPEALLSEKQALKMASTLDVRSTKHRTHG